MLFSKAVGGAVGPRTSVLSMSSIFNKPVEPKSVAEIVMGQTIWKTTPTMSLIGGGMGLGYGFFENSKGDNFGGPVDVSGFGASGATIGAGVGAACRDHGFSGDWCNAQHRGFWLWFYCR